MEEIWKAIVGYEGLYEVSNFGRIRSLNYRRTGEVQELELRPNTKGYLIIDLSKNGKVETFKVHRLVANAFIPNPHNLDTVNHIDHNRQNNNVSNLEWLSREDNTSEAQRSKGIKKVICVETQQIFSSIVDACDWLGVDYKKAISNISKCCKGKRKTAYGYHWQRVD